jgi:hypothetical protein
VSENADPLLYLAQHRDFRVIYTRLTSDRLARAVERPIVEHTLHKLHPYALFVFANCDLTQWDFVNVKYSAGDEDEDNVRRRTIRRIHVGPDERLHTAAQRLAMLAVPRPDTSALELQGLHDQAFDVEAVKKDFFTAYRALFQDAEGQIGGVESDARRLFTQKLFNRLMFIIFLERKGWLTFAGRPDYLRALWQDHALEKRAREKRAAPDANFYRDRLKLLFFAGLNTPHEVNVVGIRRDGFLQMRIGDVPYLNGGLFEEEEDDRAPAIRVPDDVLGRAMDELFYRFNFTVVESTPLDVEVAVDPEMLGKMFEELVTGRHETGSYYTPKPVVAFMGREALKGYLQSSCPRDSAEALAVFVDARDPSGLANPEVVLDALKAVKVCDPACGSGAYLLGMLHELLDLRACLFATRGLDALTAYQRKLEIIQHNLYGVDLDPFAVNIARLRLWLSLVVDFEGQNPPPLPNLDFKIEVGDSLTAPDPSGGLQPDLFRYQKNQDYFRLKADYLMARGGEKLTLRDKINALRQEIAAWMLPPPRAGLPAQAGEGRGGGFDWAVEFAEVFSPQFAPTTLRGAMTTLVNVAPGQMELAGQAAGGFVVVLANPPYVRQELLQRDYKDTLKRIYPEVYTGVADLYVYFYARALQLLHPDGMLAFISSNKFMRAGYGEKLRRLLAQKTTIQTAIDFGDLSIFAAATYPTVLVVRRRPPAQGQTVQALTVDDLNAVHDLDDIVRRRAWRQPQAGLRVDGWALARPDVQALLEKLRRCGKPLGEYVEGQFYYGIKTGLNEAFVIDQATRDRLVAKDPRSAEIIKPWLRGRDVKRWRAEKCGLYIVYVPWGFPIEEYLAIYGHLQQYESRLSNRPEVKEGRFPWYALSRYAAQYVEGFNEPKIIYPHFNIEPNFAYDSEGALSNDKTYIIPNASLYLLGILNSRVTAFFLRQVCPSVQQGYMEFRTIYIEQIPVPAAASTQRAAIESLVRKLLDAHRRSDCQSDPTNGRMGAGVERAGV